MTRYIFEEITRRAVKSVPCALCGKRVKRQRTFVMTDNPWNVNPDGSRCTIPEIREKLRVKAAAWEAEPERHARCAA